MHFSTSDISGSLSPITQRAILNICIDYSSYNDPYQGIDGDFKESLSNFINEHATTGFAEFMLP
jgi:hypothetical protein